MLHSELYDCIDIKTNTGITHRHPLSSDSFEKVHYMKVYLKVWPSHWPVLTPEKKGGHRGNGTICNILVYSPCHLKSILNFLKLFHTLQSL